ncbi:MAG: glycosyltransferase [Actinobacteria bacterium]|nr:glycosyltransferase [Actinomycetota bacterium]
MKILSVSAIDYSTPSAAASRHLALFDGLAGSGDELAFLVPGRTTRPNLEVLEEHGQTVGAARTSPRSWGRRMSALEPWWGVERRVQESEIDVVVCWDRDPAVLGRAIGLARSLGVPVVHELTEYPDVVAPRPAILGTMHDAWFRRIGIRKLSGAMVISEPLASYVRSHAGGRMPLIIVPPVIDASRFASDLPESARAPSFRVGYFGSLSRRKDGIDWLLSAVERANFLLSRNRIGIEIGLWGSGPDKSWLLDEIHRRGISDSVHLSPPIPSAEVVSAMQSMDALILPRPVSRQATGGLSTKLAEYLATGRPVIATATGDTGRFILDGKTALVVPPNDVTALANALCSLATDPLLAARLGNEGRELAMREFNARKHGLRIHDWLETLVEVGK